jgi:molybdopterin converting factor small subunit
VAEVVPAEVRVRYFAAAAEASGVENETVAVSELTLGALQDALLERYGEPMSRVLRSGSFLVAGVVRRDRATALSGTVDVLPPFAGG